MAKNKYQITLRITKKDSDRLALLAGLTDSTIQEVGASCLHVGLIIGESKVEKTMKEAFIEALKRNPKHD